jgi:hypothetical protein
MTFLRPIIQRFTLMQIQSGRTVPLNLQTKRNLAPTWHSIQVFCVAETVVDAEEHYKPGRHHG